MQIPVYLGRDSYRVQDRIIVFRNKALLTRHLFISKLLSAEEGVGKKNLLLFIRETTNLGLVCLHGCLVGGIGCSIVGHALTLNCAKFLIPYIRCKVSNT